MKKRKEPSGEEKLNQYDYCTKNDRTRTASPSRMNRDILWHVLYDSDLELIRDITLPSAQRMENEKSSGNSEIISYVELCKNLTVMRALFFVLLNIDEQLRSDVCSVDFCSRVWTCHGKPAPLCSFKASRFFQDLETSCIHGWMRNERCTAAVLVENIRILYTCS